MTSTNLKVPTYPGIWPEPATRRRDRLARARAASSWESGPWERMVYRTLSKVSMRQNEGRRFGIVLWMASLNCGERLFWPCELDGVAVEPLSMRPEVRLEKTGWVGHVGVCRCLFRCGGRS